MVPIPTSSKQELQVITLTVFFSGAGEASP